MGGNLEWLHQRSASPVETPQVPGRFRRCKNLAISTLESAAFTIHKPSTGMEKMTRAAQAPRDKVSDSEKITINLGYVDLGRADLLVQEGFYANRTDFIRTAIRNQLATHAEAVTTSIARHTLELGLRDYSKADLEAVTAAGEQLHIKLVGLARISPDVSPALALAAIASIHVLGALQASAAVKLALGNRIT